MSFLRRLLVGRDDDAVRAGAAVPAPRTDAAVRAADAGASGPAPLDDEDERAHELELARFEQDRTSDLVRRQQRYSDRSWTPPRQGGEKRAGEDESEG